MPSGNMSPTFALFVVAVTLLFVGVFIYYVILRKPTLPSGKNLRSLFLGTGKNDRDEHTRTIHEGFMIVLWGFLLIFLDIRAKGIDMLPDFAGYILIAIGLSRLSPLNQKFGKAKVFATIMIFLSLTNLVEFRQLISHYDSIIDSPLYWYSALYWFGSVPLIMIPSMIVLTTGIALDLIMVWYICGGIIGITAASDNSRLAGIATTRRNLYLALAIAGWCFSMFFSAIPGMTSISSPLLLLVVISFAIFSIVVMCLMMRLMKEAGLEISGNIEVVRKADN